MSKRKGFAQLSLAGEDGGTGFSSPLNGEAYKLLWNLYVNAKVTLSLVMGLGSAHWPPCSYGESVTGPLTSSLAGGLWDRVPGGVQSAITPPLETAP